MYPDLQLSHLTDAGIPGIGTVPYGAHLCQFYPTRQALVESLVPYFVAGLRGNERCVWVTADPLPASQARMELAKVMPDLPALEREGRLRILSHEHWYERALAMSREAMIDLWLGEERKALARGFRGLRVTGNTSFVTGDGWDRFMAYESALSEAFRERRVLALCSYMEPQCDAEAMVEVAQHHHHALKPAHPHWQVFTPC